MFYILIILGLILVLAGIYKNRYFEDIPENTKTNSWEEKYERLVDRVNRMEENISVNKSSFQDMLSYERKLKNNKIKIPKEYEDISNKSKEKFKLVREYEKEGFTLEEICILLEMNKGEVLLFKSLYENQ